LRRLALNKKNLQCNFVIYLLYQKSSGAERSEEERDCSPAPAPIRQAGKNERLFFIHDIQNSNVYGVSTIIYYMIVKNLILCTTSPLYTVVANTTTQNKFK
jgi:hypothetical protein